MLKVIELFAGIGSQTQALKNIEIEHEVVGIAEIDKYAIQSYEAIHGKVNNFGDISKIEKLPYVDLWTYSFPCQDLSVAGKQLGLMEGKRSGLLWEVERLLESSEKPKYLLLENVKNLVGKGHKADFDKWLNKLEQLGYNNYWKVLNAKDYGIPQNRERVFCISIRNDVNFKGHNFPDKQELKLKLKDMLEDEVDEKYYIKQEKTEKLLKSLKDKEILEGGIKVSRKGEKFEGNTDYNLTLLARDYKGLGNQQMTAVCVSNNNAIKQVGMLDIRGNEQVRRVYDENGISPTLNTMQGGNRQPKVIIKEATKQGYAIAGIGDSINIEQPSSQTRRGRVGVGVAQTLTTNPQQVTLQSDYRIRKLTPLECWRLMGFKDEQFNKAKDSGVSNSQLYKQAGNSICVPVLEEIFKSLLG